MSWFALLLGLIGLIFGIIEWLSSRQILRKIDQMLSSAIDGSFRENTFDESAQSALENKMARFLNGSASSARNLERERGAIQSLISDISHQTKTPIANILLYASLLSEEELSENQKAELKTLSVQAEKLSFLIESLVKASRLETGIVVASPKAQPVAPLMEHVLCQACTLAQNKGITLQMLSSEGQARYDLRWTEEALFNVVDNAVKYTPEGGRVTLSATMYEMFCRIDVSDTGIGIGEEEQAKIFQRFYRGQQVREKDGLGIGLYLTREILHLQGGYIKVSSEQGKGSVFSLYLPVEHLPV